MSMEFILMTDIMLIIFYILEPTAMTPKETREYTFFLYTRIIFQTCIISFLFLFLLCFWFLKNSRSNIFNLA